jgi:hypothetical protein
MNRRTVHNMPDAQSHARKCLEEQLIVSAALIDNKDGHPIHFNKSAGSDMSSRSRLGGCHAGTIPRRRSYRGVRRCAALEMAIVAIGIESLMICPLISAI